jgi:hypothetical protein
MATVTRQRRDVGGRQVPWGRFIPADCACDHRACCLYHFDDSLDWQGRALTYALIGVTPPTGR